MYWCTRGPRWFFKGYSRGRVDGLGNIRVEWTFWRSDVVATCFRVLRQKSILPFRYLMFNFRFGARPSSARL